MILRFAHCSSGCLLFTMMRPLLNSASPRPLWHNRSNNKQDSTHECEASFHPLPASYADAGRSVKIADLDVGQGTSSNWQGRRLQNKLNPIIPAKRFGNTEQAMQFDPHWPVLGYPSGHITYLTGLPGPCVLFAGGPLLRMRENQ